MSRPSLGRVWDVVVIGAGPAGSVSAYGLARAGLRVLMVDRSGFPRSKVCGGCISARAMARLSDLGLRDVVAGSGVSLRRFHVRHRGSVGMDASLPGGVSLSRARFDTALVERAVQAGIEFRAGLHARVLGVRSAAASTRSVLLTGDGGCSEVVRAHAVVVADGLGHPSLAGLDGFRSRVTPRSYIGVGTLLSDDEAGYARGTIFMGLGRAGYVGLVRVETGALNIAAAIDPHRLGVPGGIGTAVGVLLREAGLRIPRGLSSAAWLATPPLTQTSGRVGAHRLLVAGDAAGYVEPFTGEGIAWALSDACAVADILPAGIGDWNVEIGHRWRSARRLASLEQRGSRLVRLMLRSGVARSMAFGAGRAFPELVHRAVYAACAP